MKTSVIEVRDMLSVLSVDGVESRFGEVPGVESVTVDFAGGTATVRYDETRLEISDIKSAVRQLSYTAAAPVHAVPDAHTVPAAAASKPAMPAPAAASSSPVQPAKTAPVIPPAPVVPAKPTSEASAAKPAVEHK